MRTHETLALFILILLSSCFSKNNSKQEPSLLSQQIDSIFSSYNDGPGVAVAVIKEGEIIFSEGYGYMNMDYKIPNSATSKFYIGSMAKQFCGAALLRLEHENKIDFSKPINDYLEEFPKYDDTITVAQIIHHTSGIRGTSSMQLIAGVKSDFEDYFSANQQYELIKAQKDLNFQPGSEFRYSSGGYIVLAKLIEKVTGKSFREYLDEIIFQPLGMDNTLVIDNHREIVEDRVVSYFPSENGGFERRSLIFDGMGDGSILTTTQDLAKWDKAFYDDELLGIPNFSERMYHEDQVASGNDIHYGMALQTSAYKGHKVVHHNGGMLGFRADLIRFPEKEMSIIVLANFSEINSTGKAFEIADFILESKNQDSNKKEPTQFKVADEAMGRNLEGKYFSHDLNMWRRISFANDSLFYDSGNQDYKIPLWQVNDSTFQIVGTPPPIQLKFSNRIVKIDYGWAQYDFEYFDDTPPTRNEILRYLGKYYSEELNTYYTIYEKENRILVRINNNEPFEIFPNPEDKRINWNSKSMVWLGFAMMKFKFNQDASVSGFEIGDNRVKGILFQKINTANF